MIKTNSFIYDLQISKTHCSLQNQNFYSLYLYYIPALKILKVYTTKIKGLENWSWRQVIRSLKNQFKSRIWI